MRVLFFHAYPHQFAGAQRVTLELCRQLSVRGHRAAVCTVDDGPFPRELREAGVEALVVRAPAAWRKYGRALETPRVAALGAATLPLYWAQLARALRAWGPDVLHVNDHRGALLAAASARLARVPMVWHLHGTYASRAITHLGAAAAKTILVVSHHTRSEQLWLDRYEHKITILHNGMLTAAPSRADSGRTEPPLVLTGARTHPDKGLDVLIRAAAEVHARSPEVRFQIAGPVQRGYEDYHRELQALRDGLGLAEVVEFSGVVEDPRAVWAGASVYVQSSRKEPFGMGVLEAMALGVPVVTTRVGGMKEIVEDGRSGLQVESEDHRALADAILRALNDERGRESLVAEARRRVERSFSAEAMVDRLLEVYEGAVR